MVKRAVAFSSLFFLLASPTLAQTTVNDVVLTSCIPNAVVNKDNSFVADSGDTAVFTCTLTNKGTTEATVLLSGERTRDTATDLTPPSSTAFAVVVPPQETIKEDIPFTSIFENGTYRYTITLKNLSDGESFGTTLTFSSTSTLDAPTIRIVDVTLDKTAYTREDIGSFLIVVATSSSAMAGEEVTPFFLDAILKGASGEVCAYAVLDRQLVSEKERMFFSFAAVPNECSITTLEVLLKDESGFPQDSRDIPLVVQTLNLVTTKLVLALLVVVALTALAWTLWVQRRRRTKSIVL